MPYAPLSRIHCMLTPSLPLILPSSPPQRNCPLTKDSIHFLPLPPPTATHSNKEAEQEMGRHPEETGKGNAWYSQNTCSGTTPNLAKPPNFSSCSSLILAILYMSDVILSPNFSRVVGGVSSRLLNCEAYFIFGQTSAVRSWKTSAKWQLEQGLKPDATSCLRVISTIL